jgi:hypothetical protein
MSAFGGKADINERHPMSAFDPKRTSAVPLCCAATSLRRLRQSRNSSLDAAGTESLLEKEQMTYVKLKLPLNIQSAGETNIVQAHQYLPSSKSCGNA